MYKIALVSHHAAMGASRRCRASIALVAVLLLSACVGAPERAEAPTTTVSSVSPTSEPGRVAEQASIGSLQSAPEVFVASVDRRIAVVDASTGSLRRFLTAQRRWVADSYPTLAASGGRQYVYYLHENMKRCPNSVRRVPFFGGESERVTHQPFQIMGLSVSPNGRYLAYSYEGCRAPVTTDFVDVLALSTGETLFTVSARVSYPAAPIGLGAVTVTNHHLVAFAGVHLTTWLAVLNLDQAPGRFNLRSLPQIPVRCRLDRLAASPSRARVFGSVACAHSRIKTFTASGANLQKVQYSEPIPLDLDWGGAYSRNHQGWYVGFGNPRGKGGGEHIIQWRGRSARMLGKCSTPKSTGGLCAATPTWSSLPRPKTVYAGSAKQSREQSVQAFLDEGGRLCGNADLRRRFVMGGGAGGWVVGGLTLVNTSHQPCALLGPVRFVGTDSAGHPVTSVSTCDDMVSKHQSCSAPVVLYPLGTAEPRQHPNAIYVRLLGWGRGGHNDSGCPQKRVVQPQVLSLDLGDLSLRLPNHDPAWARTESSPGRMWGCGDIGIMG